MTTELPEARQTQSPDEHMQISRRFIEHAREEFARGERLQASEKIWGAAQHALKAIGKERGWNTEDYSNTAAIAGHLSEEFSKPRLLEQHVLFKENHLNFYRNHIDDEGVIRLGIDSVADFVQEMERIREQPPQPFTITAKYQLARLHLMDAVPRNPEIGRTYTSGFVNPGNLMKWQEQWDARGSNGDDNDLPSDDDGDDNGGVSPGGGNPPVLPTNPAAMEAETSGEGPADSRVSKKVKVVGPAVPDSLGKTTAQVVPSEWVLEERKPAPRHRFAKGRGGGNRGADPTIYATATGSSG